MIVVHSQTLMNHMNLFTEVNPSSAPDLYMLQLREARVAEVKILEINRINQYYYLFITPA